jgi:hypothetical protein
MEPAGSAESGSMEPERKPVRVPGIVTREIAGETILVPVRHGVSDLNCIFTLNETASLVWRMIDGTQTVSDVVRAACVEFGVADSTAEAEISAFLAEMHSAGLVSFDPQGSGTP